MFSIQWSGVAKLVLVMEWFLSCNVVAFDGKCGSWNLVMVGSDDSTMQENGGNGFYKMEVLGRRVGSVLMERTKFF
jgi:hypothetical protein